MKGFFKGFGVIMMNFLQHPFQFIWVVGILIGFQTIGLVLECKIIIFSWAGAKN